MAPHIGLSFFSIPVVLLKYGIDEILYYIHFQSPTSHFKGGPGKQELCPNSGVYIPAMKLKALHHKAGFNLKIIFHELVDHFFTDEELASSVAFGTRKVPDNMSVLNPAIVSSMTNTWKPPKKNEIGQMDNRNQARWVHLLNFIQEK